MADEDDDNVDEPDVHDDFGGSSSSPPPAGGPVVARPQFLPDSDEPLRVSTVEEILAKANKDNAKYLKLDDPENLGDHFMDTPWLPPTIEEALNFKTRNVYRGGDAPWSSIRVTDAPDLGASVCLYFTFVRAMAILFFFCTLLSVPSIVFSFFGQGIPLQDRDAIGLYRFTLGNLGYDQTSATYVADSRCHNPKLGSVANDTCVTLAGVEVSLSVVSNVLTATEFVQCLLFFIVVWYLKSQRHSLMKSKQLSDLTVSCYSVMVRHIPKDTTVEELVGHFSNLYPLDVPDWKGRPPVAGAVPVQDAFFSGLQSTVGTWVAECVVHKRIGDFLYMFQKKQQLTDRLFRYRAQMKMYSENTPHSHGPNAKRFTKAEKKMFKATEKIDTLTKKLVKQCQLKFRDKTADVETGVFVKDVQYYIDADSVSAFLTFDYCESFARCIEDYRRYNSFPLSLCYPSVLKLRGHKIKVTPAPAPEDLVWENLEVSAQLKIFRRIRSALIGIVFMVVCFVAILQASIYKTKFNSGIPKVALCSSEVPRLYQNGSQTISLSAVRFARPLTNTATYDNKCNAAIPGSFYGVYGRQGDFLSPVGKYDINACTQAAAKKAGYNKDYGVCPRVGQPAFCPCFSLTSKDSDVCQSVDCVAFPGSPLCQSFSASTMATCYCINNLYAAITSGGVISALQGRGSAQSGIDPVCNNFLLSYSQGVGFTYLAIFVAVVVNQLVLSFVGKLTEMESHLSTSRLQQSLFQKVFVTIFVNVAVLAILASGRVDDAPSALQLLSILQGSYSDFSSQWFGTVGTYFILMFVVNALPGALSGLWTYYVSAPFARYRFYTLIMYQASHSVVRQHEVNMMEVGPKFDETISFATLMALLFFGMVYASGLPIMTLLMFITFLFYFYSGKLLLARYCMKPGRFGDSTMSMALQLMPYAGMLRLAVACWIYSIPNLLSTKLVGASTSVGGSAVSTSSYTDLLNSALDTANQQFPLGGYVLSRVGLPTVFPLFLLLVVVVVIQVIGYLWRVLPFYWLGLLVKSLYRRFCKREIQIHSEESADGESSGAIGYIRAYDIHKLQDPLRREVCSYSGEYFKYMKSRNEIPKTCVDMCRYSRDIHIDADEVDDGWEREDMDEYMVKVKRWATDSFVGNVGRKEGDRKHTYEIVAENSCQSYNLDVVPSYKPSIMALKLASISMAKFEDTHADLAEKYRKKREQKKREKIQKALDAQAELSWKDGDDPDGKKKKKKGKYDKDRSLHVDYDLGDEEEWRKADEEDDEDEEGNHHHNNNRDGKDDGDASSEGAGLN